MSDYPWYTTVSHSMELQQGDLIEKCPVLIPPSSMSEGGQYEVVVQYADVVIISQSCDLENSSIEMVLVCPYYLFEDFAQKLSKTAKDKKLGLFSELSKGRHTSYHILNKEQKIDLNDFPVIDFKNVYGVNIDFLKKHAKEITSRPRLLPPYREHLSQSFARFFMRVGLPSNLKYEG